MRKSQVRLINTYFIPTHIQSNFTLNQVETLPHVLWRGLNSREQESHKRNCVPRKLSSRAGSLLEWFTRAKAGRAFSRSFPILRERISYQFDPKGRIPVSYRTAFHPRQPAWNWCPKDIETALKFAMPEQQSESDFYTWIFELTSLNCIKPEIPGVFVFRRWNDSCHFAATWDFRASVAMSPLAGIWRMTVNSTGSCVEDRVLGVLNVPRLSRTFLSSSLTVIIIWLILAPRELISAARAWTIVTFNVQSPGSRDVHRSRYRVSI